MTRKRKLLEKQAEGKRRMKRVGNVDIPQEASLTCSSWSGRAGAALLPLAPLNK